MINKLIKVFLYNFLIFFSFLLHAQEQEVIGFVIDEKSNEKLAGALIISEGTGVAISDSFGFFSVRLKIGFTKLECKYVGYEGSVKEIVIEAGKNEIIFYLKPLPIEISKVTITGEQFNDFQDSKIYELHRGELQRIPVFLESDALRSLQTLPGVTSFHDLSSHIYLRGGNFDETLIHLDNIPVYNSYHLGGAFGSFNPDIIEREILYPSNYPVKYQGALSGILNIFTRNGNSEKVKGTASVGLAASKLFLEGPLLKGNFTLSARRTYPDILFKLLGNNSFPYFFYDLHGKYSLPVNKYNLITISGFYSKDIFELFNDGNSLIIEKKDDLNWGNRIAKISHTYFFKTGEINTDLYYSN